MWHNLLMTLLLQASLFEGSGYPGCRARTLEIEKAHFSMGFALHRSSLDYNMVEQGINFVLFLSRRQYFLHETLMIGRVGISIPHVGILCVPCFSSLSVRGVSHYSTLWCISMPLTEPCLRFFRTRLFGNASLAQESILLGYESQYRVYPLVHL